MNIQERYDNRRKNLDRYFLTNEKMFIPLDECDLTFDIEVAPNKDKDKAITYSVAIMCCNDDLDICYKYDTMEQAIKEIMNLQAMKINIYVHNLFYDIKPWIISWIKMYENKQILETTKKKEWFSPYTKKTDLFEVLTQSREKPEPYSYKPTLKKGQMYACEFYGGIYTIGNKEVQKTITFKDSYKIATLSLANASKNFLGLILPKDGLDYDKVREVGCSLTETEKGYIYDDVFALKYIIKKLVIDGFIVNGRLVKYTKLTNSSQSLADYKIMLLEDYNLKQNSFKDKDFDEKITFLLVKNGSFFKENKSDIQKANILFETVYPKLSYYDDDYLRNAYYGGMTYVDFENIKKIEKKSKTRSGLVYDVNSLYPFCMESFELPIGKGNLGVNIPYENMSAEYKKQFPLYVQTIRIYDMKVKKDKIPFIQVKDNPNFNGRQIIKENINLFGKKEVIDITLPSPMLEMLFECYDVLSYELGTHFAFESKKGLFDNYLNFWGEIKRKSKGAEKQVAKLRQNGLYGKFGTAGDNEIALIDTTDDKFNVIHTHTNYIGDTLYLPTAMFITAYAKCHLIKAINSNRHRFMYCDTDSIHLSGTEPVKGIDVDDNIYGAWKHEMIFDDYKYVGSKRYAERAVIKRGDKIKLDNFYLAKWEFKCCGLSEKIMKQIDDIKTFTTCPHNSKELKKLEKFSKDDIYYYYDKECTKRIPGLFRSSKSKIVPGGTLILEQPYQLTQNSFFY